MHGDVTFTPSKSTRRVFAKMEEVAPKRVNNKEVGDEGELSGV